MSQKTRSAVSADFDDDGDQDVVAAAGDGSVTWYENTGSGDFSTGGELKGSGTSVHEVATGDLNGNGRPDVLVANGGSVDLYRNTESDFKAIPVVSDVGSVSAIDVADLDGDSFPELVLSDADNGTVLAVGNELGIDYPVEDTLAESAGEVSSLAINDVNEDGNLDVLSASPTNNTVAWYENLDGDGSFSGSNAITESMDGASTVVLSDVDRDLDPDAVVSYQSSGTIEWYENIDGLDGFSSTSNLVSSEATGVQDIFLADMDTDADPDIVAAATGRDEIVWFENLGDEGDLFSSLKVLTDDAAGVRTVAASDLDEDFILDVLSAQGDGSTLVFYRGTRLAGANTSTVESDETISFGDTGVEIGFSGTSGSGDVSVEKFAAGPTGTDGIGESNVSDYRFKIDAEEEVAFAEAEVRFDAGSLGGINDASNVVVYSRPSVDSGQFTGLETNYDPGSDELIVTVDAFSEFVFASNSEPLPVELAGFEASLAGESEVHLRWSTASETGSAGFEVQRRGVEGAPWQKVGYIESKADQGTTNEKTTYQFVDNALPYEANSLTYRLRQVDVDGTTNVTEEVTVTRSPQEVALLSPFPNPARSHVTTRFSVPEQQHVKLELYDVLGRRVRTLLDGKREGRQETKVGVSDLSSGVYFLRLKAGGLVKTERVVVTR